MLGKGSFLSTPAATSHAALSALRRFADELAAGRGERATTGHLLAAVARTEGPGAGLLAERRLDGDVLLQAARVLTDDVDGAVGRALDRARGLALRAAGREPGGLHLLIALCHEPKTASYRALEQCGVDVSKLRAAAMQLAMGLVAPRRVASAQQKAAPQLVTPPPRSDRAPLPVVRAAPPRPPSVPSAPSSTGSAFPAAPAAPPSAPSETVTRGHATDASPSAPVGAPAAPKPKARAPGRHGKKGGQDDKRAMLEARFTLDPKATPLLCQIGKNLTLAALHGELDPVVGREEEIERVLDVLAKRDARNPCVVGAPGVGKTSVVRGLATAIAERAAGARPGHPASATDIDERIVVEIEPAALLSGTALRGALAERVVQLKNELQAAGGRVVVFFDEIHTLFAEASDEGTAELKAALARGELVCIGACTRDEFRRFVEADAALLRRFSAIEVEEPSREDAFLALEAVAPAFEKHHGVVYAKEALASAIAWSARYVPGRALPDKALGILDLAGARVRRRSGRDVAPEDVADVVADLADVPRERLLETDGERMLRLAPLLSERVVGHTDELEKIAAVLRRNASGLRGRRPIGTFLLLGPTGVGKTETAKAIAEALFHNESAMTRLDMSEYAEPHAIARLVGAPPGYVGHEAGGQLTEAIRKRPYQVILLDEIEKAHRDVLEAFLQVFDEGRLTDGRGRTVDFTSAVLVLTSNLGADRLMPSSQRRGIGFSASRENDHVADVRRTLHDAARAGLPPELYNRIDEVLAFGPLRRSEVAEVARRMLGGLADALASSRGLGLDVAGAVIDVLLDEGGFDVTLGARPMRRAITRLIEAPLSELLLREDTTPGDVVRLDVEDGRVAVRIARARSA